MNKTLLIELSLFIATIISLCGIILGIITGNPKSFLALFILFFVVLLIWVRPSWKEMIRLSLLSVIFATIGSIANHFLKDNIILVLVFTAPAFLPLFGYLTKLLKKAVRRMKKQDENEKSKK